jgi:hypothetical protein
MNNKQLAEMIRSIRKAKLNEIIGKPEKFNPKHKTTHPEDPTSPNQPFHEEKLDEILGGTYYKRKKNIFKSRLKPNQRTWTKTGQQSMGGRYTAEEEKKLGSTDTGSSGEEIDVNPNIPTAKGETTKNTTVKETKEK